MVLNIWDGSSPPRKLLCKSTQSRLVKFEIDEGIVPTSLFS